MCKWRVGELEYNRYNGFRMELLPQMSRRPYLDMEKELHST